MRRLAVIAFLTILLGAVSAIPAAAAERTAVFQANVTIPVFDAAALGTLTLIYDDVTGEGTWDFQGTIAGTPAFASGKGVFDTATASGVRALADISQTTMQLTMTQIDRWNMPGFSPYTPRTATARAVGELVYVDYQGRSLGVVGIPLAFNPPLELPIEGTYIVTDAASGEQPVQVLPGTGSGALPGAMTDESNLPIAVTLLGLLAVLGVGWRMRLARLHT